MIHIYRTDNDDCLGYFDAETSESRFILNSVEQEFAANSISLVDFGMAMDLPPGVVALVKAFVFQKDQIICYPVHIPSYCRIKMLFRNQTDENVVVQRGDVMVSISFMKALNLRPADVFVHTSKR